LKKWQRIRSRGAARVVSDNGAYRTSEPEREPPTAITPFSESRAVIAVSPELAERAVGYAQAADAPNTRRAYASQWRLFDQWCRARGLSPLPAEPAALALFVTERADTGSSVSTINQGVAAVAQRHARAKLASPTESPEVRLVMQGIRKRLGTAKKRAAPVVPDALRRMSQAVLDSPIGLRDRALMLVGFAGALRRHELVDLDARDVEFTEDGLLVTLRRSKTDQEGAGAVVAVPYGSDRATCPVRSLRAWLDASAITEGAIFRGYRGKQMSAKRLDGRDVARILQKIARRADVSLDGLSGHSLRAGLGTTAAKQGKRLEVIQKHMRHKRLEQTLEYVRQARAFDEDDNAASGIGL
jgi:site-specific recombinase XerD